MNDASESSPVTCVKLVELHAPRMMAAVPALTALERARLFASGSMRVVAESTPIERVGPKPEKPYVPKVYDGRAGFSRPANVASCAEALALGSAIKHGEAAIIIRKHKAHPQTVQKMIARARGENLPKTMRKTS